MTQLFGDLAQFPKVDCPPWAGYSLLRRQPDFFMSAHKHGYVQLIHVLDGELEVDFGSGWQALRQNDVHVQPAGRPHALRSRGGYAQFGLNFGRRPDERGLLAAVTETFARSTTLHLPFREAWYLPLPPDVARRSRAAWLRLLSTLDDYTVALLETQAPDAHDPRTQRLLAYLNENLTRRVSVAEAAQLLHQSRAALQRLCRRHFRCGLAHLHERLRLDHAASHLLRTSATITECAALCGYADVYHFSRAFKRVHGLSPQAYRRAQRDALA